MRETRGYLPERGSDHPAILLEQNDEWAVQRARYMTLEAMALLGETAAVSLPTLAA